MFQIGDAVKYHGHDPKIPFAAVGHVSDRWPNAYSVNFNLPPEQCLVTHEIHADLLKPADPHIACPEHAHQFMRWLRERGGVAVWNCEDLARAGQTWSTSLYDAEGVTTKKPYWACGRIIRVITRPSEIVVHVPKELRRFHVALRRGGQGMTLKLTDASKAKLNKAMNWAHRRCKSAWYEFDYCTQEAVIYVPESAVPLAEYCAKHPLQVQEEVKA